MRIGMGFDVHQLVENRALIIGGVTIPFEKGLAGHSDADVLLHAITDALLGGLALGDIGSHFPDTDPTYKGADSTVLLATAYQKILDKNYVMGNLDCTICAQAPKMKPFILQMRQNISECLKTDIETISVKATTTEHLGFVGRGEGIAAQAVVLLRKIA